MSEILTDKKFKSYNYISRYASSPVYYHTEDHKYVVGTTKRLSKDNTYVLHTVKRNDTFDSISFTYYNSPLYYWVIMDFNDILDPFTELTPGSTLRIPTLSSISFEGDV